MNDIQAFDMPEENSCGSKLFETWFNYFSFSVKFWFEITTSCFPY